MADEREQIARRWFEQVWNQRSVDAIRALMADDAVGDIEGGRATKADFIDFHARLCDAFPDLHFEIERTALAGDDEVAVRWRLAGTHQGDALGVRPSGKRVALRGTTWFVVRDGQVVGGWDTWNQGYLMTRIGAPDAVASNILD